MASIQHTAPIGASLVRILRDLDNDEVASAASPTPVQRQIAYSDTTSKQSRSEKTEWKPTLPCLTLPLEQTQQHSSRRLLLQGPSQSGRTSLAMNLAYACAASIPPCQCLETVCQCTCVNFYRFARSSHSERQQRFNDETSSDFPLFCCRLNGDTNAHFHSGSEFWVSGLGHTNVSASQQRWDPQILRRIRIVYVHSPREVLDDLLGCMALPIAQQPSRALVFDDLDLICESTPPMGGGGSGIANNPSSLIMQILAIAVDTSYALERHHGITPYILASALSDAKIVAPWFDQYVSLQCQATSGVSRDINKHLHFNDCRRAVPQVAGSYQAVIRRQAGSASSIVAAVDYSVVNFTKTGPMIQWECRKEA